MATAVTQNPPILDARQGKGPQVVNPRPTTSLLQRKTEIAAKSTKILFYGGEKSGKTTTAAELAIAISKEYYDGAPVAMHDTERGWQFPKYILPLFQAGRCRTRPAHKPQIRRHGDGHAKRPRKRAGLLLLGSGSELSHLGRSGWRRTSGSATSEGELQFQHWGDMKLVKLWNERWVKRFLGQSDQLHRSRHGSPPTMSPTKRRHRRKGGDQTPQSWGKDEGRRRKSTSPTSRV